MSREEENRSRDKYKGKRDENKKYYKEEGISLVTLLKRKNKMDLMTMMMKLCMFL